MTQKFFKYASVGAIALMLFTGCNSGSSSSETSSTSTNVGAASTGTIFGSTTRVQSSSQTSSAKSISANAGTIYNVPIYNLSASDNLTVTGQSVVNGISQVWTTESTVPAECQNIVPGDHCTISVGFKASNIESAAQLSTILTVNYANGTISTIPLAGTTVTNGASGSGVIASIASTIAVNESGDGSGMITLFNRESFIQTVEVNSIAATNQMGVSWKFHAHCGILGNSTIAANDSCSVEYVYHVSSSVTKTPDAVTITIPVTSSHGINNITVGPTQQMPVPSTVSPQAYLSYPSGASVLLPAPNTGSGSIVVKNLGNEILASITATPSVSTILADTSGCANLAPQSVCSINVTQTTATDTASVILTPSSGASGNIVVPVGGQALAVSPISINFGNNVSTGSTITQTMMIQNQSSNILASLAITTELLNSAYSLDSSGCGSMLAAFSSCQVYVSYSPTTDGTQTGIVNVNAKQDLVAQSQVSIALSGVSIISEWINLLESPIAGYPSGFPVLSMDMSDSGRLLFGITPPIDSTESGLSNVWSVSGSNSYVNLTGLKPGYNANSAPTALASLPGVNTMDIGHADGSVQRCPISISFAFCNSLVATSTDDLGVTSLLHVGIPGTLFVSYADNMSGTTGQVLFGSVEQLTLESVSAITSGVGVMATDGRLTYVPLTNGKLATVNESGVIVETNIAPNMLAFDEYPTVAYVSNDESATLFIGTNQGNVYMSIVTPSLTETGSWTKLTSVALSTQSIVSALAKDGSGNLFAGLRNPTYPKIGGGVFVLNNGSNTFIETPGYTDTSSVYAMVINQLTTFVNVSTYNGNIWANGSSK